MEKILKHNNLNRVLILTDDYLPNGTRSHARMMHELAVKFHEQSWQVIVLTPGAPKQKKILEIEVFENIETWCFRAPVFRGRGKFVRAIHEIFLPVKALLAIICSGQLKNFKFDICINYSPTIFFMPLALFSRWRGAFIYLVLRDFFPQWAVDEKILKERALITKFFRLVEAINYRTSHIIALQSPANIPVFKEMYTKPSNIRILMNWSNIQTIDFELIKSSEDMKRNLKLENKVVFFYGGNIGHAQDMSNIVELARSMQYVEDAHFLFVGQGDEFELVKDLISKFSLLNITLLPSVSQKEYEKFLCLADIGLLSLSKHHKAHNFPGKMLGYMAHQLPILASVNCGNDIVNIVHQAGAGLVCYNGEDEIFKHNAILLCREKQLRKKSGICSRTLLESTFSVHKAYEKIMDAYENEMSKLDIL